MSLKPSEQNVPHVKGINNENIMSMFEEYRVGVGDYFTYETHVNGIVVFKKGLRISPAMMIPIGLPCMELENARLQD